jgi:uncharacterized protein (TIGR02300 family)
MAYSSANVNLSAYMRNISIVTKLELGAKRHCESCDAKFFDLNKVPIICPKCGTVFQSVAVRAHRATKKAKESDDQEVAPAEIEVISSVEVEATEGKAAARMNDDIEVEDDDEPDDTILEDEEDDEDDIAALIDSGLAPEEGI